MRSIKSYTAMWAMLGALILDVFIYYMLGAESIALGLNILVLGVAVTAAAAWTPAALAAFSRNVQSAGDRVTISVWSSWTILVTQRFYALSLVVFAGPPTLEQPHGSRPMWLVNSPVQSLVVTALIMAGLYVAYATVSDDELPVQDKGWTIVATSIGGFVAGCVAMYLILTGRNFG